MGAMTRDELIAALQHLPGGGEVFVEVRGEDECDAPRMSVLRVAPAADGSLTIEAESPVYFNWATLTWEPRG